MRSAVCLFVVMTLFGVLAGCAPGQRSRADTNRVLSVSYGEVIGVERVQLQSAAAGGAVLGGLAGLALGGSTRSAAAGAAIGGLGTRALEGSNQANEYTIRLTSGRDIRMVTQPTSLRLGDCVSVEQGRRANLRRVSSVHCQGGASEPTQAHRAEASACDQAKQSLVDAPDEEAMELAIRRIRILCED